MARTKPRVNLPVWREQAIEKMAKSRGKTLAFLSALPAASLVKRNTQGRWSVKDVLAHIVAWEEVAVMRLEQIMRGKGSEIVFYDDLQLADRFNDQAVARWKKIPPPVLLTGMEKVRARLIKRLLSISAEELNHPSHRHAVVEWLPEFAWTHEQSHLRRIRRWWYLERKRRRIEFSRPRHRRR